MVVVEWKDEVKKEYVVSVDDNDEGVEVEVEVKMFVEEVPIHHTHLHNTNLLVAMLSVHDDDSIVLSNRYFPLPPHPRSLTFSGYSFEWVKM